MDTFWFYVEKAGAAITVVAEVVLVGVWIWAVIARHGSSAMLLVALSAFAVGALLSGVTTTAYMIRRPKYDFDPVRAKREYRFDEEDPGIQTNTNVQVLKSNSNQAKFVEYGFSMSGDAHSGPVVVNTPGYLVFGPVQQDTWTFYYVYVGGATPRGHERVVEFSQIVKDPDFTMTPLVTVGGRSSTHELSVVFSSKKLPAGGRVVFRETSASGPHRCFHEEVVPLDNLAARRTVTGAKKSRRYGLYWEW